MNEREQIKDRGKLKWAPAAFMPEQKALLGEMLTDYERQPQRIADEYELAEFDVRIHFAMAYHLPVKLTVWDDGFTAELVGELHFIDEIARELRIKLAGGSVERVRINTLVGVEVVE